MVKPLTTPSTGIEELVDANSGTDIVATPVVMNRFENLKKRYEQYLMVKDGVELWVKNYVKEIVLPCDINLFLQQTREYEDHPNYQRYTGLFISQLMRKSYTAGNSEFKLDVNLLKPIDSLVSHVSGTKERMVMVIIKGKVRDFCGWNTQHSTFIVEEAGADYGFEAQHSVLTIEKAEDMCGFHTEHSTLTIENAADRCGWASRHSTFNTHNPEQYEKFKEFVDPNKGNTLYLLATSGSILQGGPW